MDSPKKRGTTVITEAKSALLGIIVLHLALFVVMVGYRIHTQQYYIAETEKVANVVDPLKQYEAPVKLLTKGILDAQESVVARMEAIVRHVETLDRLEQQTKDFLQSSSDSESETDNEIDDGYSEAEINSKLSQWRQLLSIGSLREIPSDDLEILFAGAGNEILAIAGVVNNGNKNYASKLAKKFLIDTDIGGNIAKQPSEFVCPVPPKELTDATDDTEEPKIKVKIAVKRQPPKNAAYDYDLEEYLEKFEENFRNRVQARGIHALFPESIESLEAKIEQRLAIVKDDVYDLADDLENKVIDQKEKNKNRRDEAESGVGASSSCVDRDLVAELVSAGLNAQTAHADIREALRKAILRYDTQISEEDLILDADLNSAGAVDTGRRGGDSVTKSINLRTMLDSPLLMKSTDWIDVLVDAIGGYSDGLDQYLDSLTGFHGTTSVGEIMVESILENAGTVGDINVGKYVDKVQTIMGRKR